MKRTKALTGHEILTALKKHQDTLDKFSVKKIGLFGSYAEGKQRSRSDIDFVVEFEKPTFDNFMGLVDFLEGLFQKKVEVLTPDCVNSIRVKEVPENIKKNVVYV